MPSSSIRYPLHAPSASCQDGDLPRTVMRTRNPRSSRCDTLSPWPRRCDLLGMPRPAPATSRPPLLVLGLLLVGGALLAGLAHRSFLSLTAAVRARRLRCWARAASTCCDFDPHSAFVGDLAIVALIVILFRDGLEVEAEMLQTRLAPAAAQARAGDAAHRGARRAGHARADRPVVDRVVPARRAAVARPTRCCPPAWSPTRACRGSCATR